MGRFSLKFLGWVPFSIPGPGFIAAAAADPSSTSSERTVLQPHWASSEGSWTQSGCYTTRLASECHERGVERVDGEYTFQLARQRAVVFLHHTQ